MKQEGFLSALRTKLSFSSNFQPCLAQSTAKTLMTPIKSLSVLDLIAHLFSFDLHYVLMFEVLNWIISLSLTLKSGEKVKLPKPQASCLQKFSGHTLHEVHYYGSQWSDWNQKLLCVWMTPSGCQGSWVTTCGFYIPLCVYMRLN